MTQQSIRLHLDVLSIQFPETSNICIFNYVYASIYFHWSRYLYLLYVTSKKYNSDVYIYNKIYIILAFLKRCLRLVLRTSYFL